MPLEKELQETGPVADTENQLKTPKRTRNADEVLLKSVKKTPSRKQVDDFLPRRSLRASTRLLNLTQPTHTTDALSTPRNAWIESEVPSSSKRRAKSVYSAKPEENEIPPSVPKSAKKRTKSSIATPKKARQFAIDIEMSDIAKTIPKPAKSCSSPADAEGSSNTGTDVLPTFERNEIDAPETIRKRGKSFTVTQQNAPTTPKRSLSMEKVALSKSTLSNVDDEMNDATDKNTLNSDTGLGNSINDMIESGEVDTEAHEIGGLNENKTQRFSVVDLTELSFIDCDSPMKTETSEIYPVVESATKTVATVERPHLVVSEILHNNESINNSSLISLPDTPDQTKTSEIHPVVKSAAETVVAAYMRPRLVLSQMLDTNVSIKNSSPDQTETSVAKSAAETVVAVDMRQRNSYAVISPMLHTNVSINNSSLISLPDTPDLFRKPHSTLNDTFSPEISVKTTNITEKEPTIIPITPVPATPKTRFSFRTPVFLKTPITSVKRLKPSPGKLLKREQTPYKPGSNKSRDNDLRFVVASTPEKQLLEAALPFTNLKSIRKRSFSVDCELPKKERQRVTFHSPANKEIPIDEIDLIMENSRREEKRDEEKKRSVTGYRRKRSFSNAETAKERARPLNELNAELERGSSSAKTKIPDFAAIHKRNFDRMESIDEYKNRKQERSKDLLSNQKVQTEVKGMTATKDSTATPVAKKNLFATSKVAAGVPKSKASAVLPQAKIVKPIMAGINKVKNRQVKNKEAYKAGNNKPKVSEAVAVENKNILRGVRSNRRFDLQMKFRNNLDQN